MIKVCDVQGTPDGYTLMETVVAMALFLSIVLPLCVMLGNFMLDGTPDQLCLALQVAEAEMSKIITYRDFVNKVTINEQGLAIYREIKHEGDLVTVKIVIYKNKKTDKCLLVLNKISLAYR